MTAHLRSQMPASPRAERPQSRAGGQRPVSQPDGRIDELVIHDLLNPMTGVLGQLELLEDQLDNDLNERDRQRLDECLASARDLSNMLVNLRHLCQLQSAQGPMQPTSTTIERLFRSLSESEDELNGARIRVKSDESHAMLRMRDDAGMLERAMHALIQSALRLSTSHCVELSAEAMEDGRVRINCRYEGKPLPDEVSRNLFTPELASLQREHGLRIDRARGMELIHHVVQLLNGTAGYEPISNGGVFFIAVPQASTSNASA